MIRAIIFDLDGTLVQTEKLKALSYAHAALELRSEGIREEEVIEAYKEVVGLSRQRVATRLMMTFKLKDEARARMAEFGVSTPWQAFVQLRLRFYDAMLVNPEVLRKSKWPHNIALLREARESDCKTALATMSSRDQVQRVLKLLNMENTFDFVATVDDVEHGKPDPEIYQLVIRELGVSPSECLVIEDSPSGVKAALAAGTWCIAVSTPFTRENLHTANLLDEQWIVDKPDEVIPVVKRLIEKRKQG